ncbi:hypothetical protein ASE36_21445 [Rhizobium sp. Root274]|nr:hypothetical protein ASC71_21505 [Rhizobium sp. Root1240]KRD25419.1 hypothetical protein ASE36_21445 [Rhizobium sp. Root274]
MFDGNYVIFDSDNKIAYLSSAVRRAMPELHVFLRIGSRMEEALGLIWDQFFEGRTYESALAPGKARSDWVKLQLDGAHTRGQLENEVTSNSAVRLHFRRLPFGFKMLTIDPESRSNSSAFGLGLSNRQAIDISAFMNVPRPVLIEDRDSRIVLINHALADLLVVDHYTASGRKTESIVPLVETHDHREVCNRVLETGNAITTHRNLRKDDLTRQFDVRTQRLFSAGEYLLLNDFLEISPPSKVSVGRQPQLAPSSSGKIIDFPEKRERLARQHRSPSLMRIHRPKAIMVTESNGFEQKASSVLSHYHVERSVTRNRGAMETMLRSGWSTHADSLIVVADAKSHWAREAILKETFAPVLIVHEEQVVEELTHFLEMPDRRMGSVSIARGSGKKEVRQDFMKPLVRNWFIDALLVEDDLEKGVEFAAMLHELGCHTEVVELSTFATRNRSIIEPQIIFFSLANALSPVMITSWVMARYRHRQGIPLIGLVPAELETIRNQFLDMGMDDAITTPVTKEDIRGILARHFPFRVGGSSL